MDFEEFVAKHIRPIYNAIIEFGTDVHQHLSLDDDEEEQLRKTAYAARDSLLIAGKVAQFSRELNKYMNDPNQGVREAVDEQRISLVMFLQKLPAIELKEDRKATEQQLKELSRWVKKRERRITNNLAPLIKHGGVAAETPASLYASSRYFRSICKDIIRVYRYLNAATGTYKEGELELEEMAA